MSVYKIEEITNIIRPIAEEYKIDRVCLFGSYARGEATDKSDIDLIVGKGNFKGFKFGGLYEDLIEAFQKKLICLQKRRSTEIVPIRYIKNLLKSLKRTER